MQADLRLPCFHTSSGILSCKTQYNFISGGKKCPDCGKQIFHDKFRVTPEVMEARWAAKQAKQREIDEVADFMS